MKEYNWTKADTLQGRERLKELLDGGLDVIAYSGVSVKYLDLSFEGGKYWLDYEYDYDTIELLIDGDLYFKFLDPEPAQAVSESTG